MPIETEKRWRLEDLHVASLSRPPRILVTLAWCCQDSFALSGSPYARRPVRLPLQQSDVQVAPRVPLALRNVLEPGGHEHEGGAAVREGADLARVAAKRTYVVCRDIAGLLKLFFCSSG